MSNFLANVARRGAGIAPRHQDEPTAAVKPVLTPVWTTQFASGLAHDRIEEQAASTFDQGADLQWPVDSVVAQAPSPQLPIPTTLIDPSREKGTAPISNPAVPADAKVYSVATAPVVLNMYSPAAVASDQQANAATEDSTARSGNDDDRQAAARPIVNAHSIIAPSKVPGSRERSDSSEAEKPAAPKLQPRQIVAPDGIDLAPPSDAGQRREVRVAARPVVQEQRVAPAPAIHVLPQPRRDAPQQSGPADHSRAEQSQIVVKIGKVEVRASQAQRPVRASRPRGSSGFAEMALRRAHLDRNYR